MKRFFSLPALVALLLRLLGALPLGVNQALGSLLGTAMACVPSSTRRVAQVNLALCFPELSERERRKLLWRCLRETGKSLTETAIFWTQPPERLERLVRETRGAELLDAKLAQRHGVVVAAPHLGAWELLGLYWARRHPTYTLYRPLRRPELEPLVRAARERSGATLLPISPRGILTLSRAVSGGNLIAILPDQEPPQQGVFAPFFGVPAKTMTLLPKLARRAEAPVLFAFAERLPWGRGFRLHFLPAPEGIDAEDEHVAARALNAGVEQCVRMAPAQYLWVYKRFRRRPDGEPGLYRG